MMRAFSPIPSEEIRPLFEFYFKPENFITNTNKYFDCTSENLPKPETDFPVSIDLHDEAIKNNSLRLNKIAGEKLGRQISNACSSDFDKGK